MLKIKEKKEKNWLIKSIDSQEYAIKTTEIADELVNPYFAVVEDEADFDLLLYFALALVPKSKIQNQTSIPLLRRRAAVSGSRCMKSR